ncbi:hypothetical protein [Geoalkalibacter halelectricus]|uniref:hypothetical protein n=1 Tax=Geoalkalibacter halelectricus TaxID=2847045 RepID=UPI003D21BB02
MKLRCPVCHASNSLEAFTADEAGRELLVLLANSGALFRPLVGYLGCFRPASRDLSHGRALKLAREVLALNIDPARLVGALEETTAAMRQKRLEGAGKPLANHNYLKKVAESLPATPNVALATPDVAPAAPTGKRAQALALLAEWGRAGWLEAQIADGLAALLTLGLDGAPASDIICRTADVWRLVVEKAGVTIEEVDAPRLRAAFTTLLRQPHKRWPDPAALVAHLPRRPERQKLDEPPISEAEREAGRRRLKELREQLAKGM